MYFLPVSELALAIDKQLMRIIITVLLLAFYLKLISFAVLILIFL